MSTVLATYHDAVYTFVADTISEELPSWLVGRSPKRQLDTLWKDVLYIKDTCREVVNDNYIVSMDSTNANGNIRTNRTGCFVLYENKIPKSKYAMPLEK